MRKSLSSGIGVTAAVAFLFSAGLADANNEYKGLTYAKAKDSITSNGGAIVISSREGSYLPTEKCIIVGSRRANFLDSSGKKSGYTVLVDLNCNDTVAGAHPGNSVASEDGKKAAQLRRSAAYINKDYADSLAAGKPSYCETHASGCKYLCENSGMCTAELLQFLGL